MGSTSRSACPSQESSNFSLKRKSDRVGNGYWGLLFPSGVSLGSYHYVGTSNYAISANSWTHLALVVGADGSLGLFVNGVAVSASTFGSGTVSGSSTVSAIYIGYGSNGGSGFTGNFAELKASLGTSGFLEGLLPIVISLDNFI